MGIGPHAIKLTRIIHDAGVLGKSFSVIELGSQDFAPTPLAAQAAIEKEFGFEDVSRIEVPADLYKAMGATSYECIDLDGYHGSHVFDLNADLEAKYDFKRQYDLVTNHGTTEHLFNQLVAFENVHRLTTVNGVMLHALPFQGYQNHGMFNYNPSLFLDISVANGYDVFGIFVSVNDKLYLYDEDFLARNSILSSSDCLILAVLIKKSEAPFQVPYDGRYFATHGKGSISALENHIGTTRRSFGNGRYEFTGLDEWAGTQASFNDRPYRFITPIWGQSYVEDFVNITLVSQLCAGNLFMFGGNRAVYTIVTTAEDAQLIKSTPQFAALSQIMPVEFILHTQVGKESPYERMSRAYNLALRRVNSVQTCFFLTGDDFYSDGLFKTAKNVIEAGKLAVMVPTVRVVRDSFRAELGISGSDTRSAAETVALLLRHEHPMATACVVNDKGRSMHNLPAQTLYRLRDGYVGRWNVMHPLAVKLRANPSPIELTVDWNYPVQNVSNVDDVYIVRDSDDGVIASVSPFSYTQSEDIRPHATRRKRIKTLKDWVDINWALNFHLLQMSEPVYLHTGEIGPEYAVGLRSVDAVWAPFWKYVQRRRRSFPEGAAGHSLELMTRATLPNHFSRLNVLARKSIRRMMSKSARRLWGRLNRMFAH